MKPETSLPERIRAETDCGGGLLRWCPPQLALEAAAEIERLRAALCEVSRRNQIMRDHMTGRLDGEAANHFFRPLAGTERIISEALGDGR